MEFKKKNISSVTCSFVTPQSNLPIGSITQTKMTVFTPRYRVTDFDSCFFVFPNVMVTNTFYFTDFIDCRVTTDGNLMVYFSQEISSEEPIPSDNTKWLFVPGKLDVSIGLKRTRRIGVTSELESISWDYVVQPQDSFPESENPGAVFTVQYAFLGSIRQQGFYPYDFWVMCGIIGGTYIIFYATFVATVFCVFQFLNIKDSGDYDQINEK